MAQKITDNDERFDMAIKIAKDIEDMNKEFFDESLKYVTELGESFIKGIKGDLDSEDEGFDRVLNELLTYAVVGYQISSVKE